MNRIQLNLLTKFQKRNKNRTLTSENAPSFNISQQVTNSFLLSIFSNFKDRCNTVRRIQSTMKSDYNTPEDL